MKPILSVTNLGFSYAGTPIFSGLQLEVAAGEFVALVGNNGAGKSTLLRLLLGELKASKGQIHLFGQDVASYEDWRTVGYLPQNGAAITAGFPASVYEIVASNLYTRPAERRLRRRDIRQRTMQALALVAMEGYARRLISELSGGQQQRVLLARVLVGQPRLMILDEPTVGIDVQTVDTLFALLHQLNREQGITVLMVTHDTDKLAGSATRVLCLQDGALREFK